jgi:uncharacterized integral membrane protein
VSIHEFVNSFSVVTTGISLAAFAVAAYFLHLRNRRLQHLEVIQTTNGQDALQLVNDTLIATRLNTHALTREQRFELAKKELDRVGRKHLYTALVVALLALLLLVFAALSVSRHRVNARRLPGQSSIPAASLASTT